MTASSEQQPDDGTDPQQTPATAAEPPATIRQSPLSRLAERFRIPLGIVVALLGAVLAVVFAVRPLDTDTGSRGLVIQGAGTALWLCVVGVGVTWALDTNRKVTNAFALVGVLCYAVFWFATS